MTVESHYTGYGLEILEELGMDDPNCSADSHFQHLKHFFAGYRSGILGVAASVEESPHSPGGARDISWRMGFIRAKKDLGKPDENS